MTVLFSPAAQRWAPIAFLAGLLCAPFLVNYFYIHQIATAAIYALVAIGLAVAANYGGLISVGHAALMAGGAYAAAYCSTSWGWQFLESMAAGIVVSMVLGLIIAIPSGRLESLYFAMVTLGLALITERILVQLDFLGGYTGLYGIPRPAIGGLVLGQVSYYYLVIVIAAVVVFAVRNVLTGSPGRQMRMVREDEIAAISAGIHPYRTKLVSFILGSVPAGIAGVLFAYLNRAVVPQTFDLHFALLFLLAVVIGGTGSLYGPVLGVLATLVLPMYFRDFQMYTNIVFGAILILILAIAPGGVTALVRALRARLEPPSTDGEDRADELHREVQDPPSWLDGGSEDLELREVAKAFRGHSVLEGVDAVFSAGRINAVIGPNGSGKTTLLNIISGFYRADSGQRLLAGAPMPGGHPVTISRLGIARTFQTPKLLMDETALYNVMAGRSENLRFATLRSMLPWGTTRREEQLTRQMALELIEFVGLSPYSNRLTSTLPHPHLRMLEIARALMANPKFLLLDEPAAGLTFEEIESLRQMMVKLADRGIGIVLVEHNMSLVMDASEHVVVLHAGRTIASGTPALVSSDQQVAAVYLGDGWAS